MRRVQGLSLPELIVVMAIIAVLSMLLQPVFANAQNGALEAKCLANLHQMGVGLTLYRDDNGGNDFGLSYGQMGFPPRIESLVPHYISKLLNCERKSGVLAENHASFTIVFPSELPTKDLTAKKEMEYVHLVAALGSAAPMMDDPNHQDRLPLSQYMTAKVHHIDLDMGLRKTRKKGYEAASPNWYMP